MTGEGEDLGWVLRVTSSIGPLEGESEKLGEAMEARLRGERSVAGRGGAAGLRGRPESLGSSTFVACALAAIVSSAATFLSAERGLNAPVYPACSPAKFA